MTRRTDPRVVERRLPGRFGVPSSCFRIPDDFSRKAEGYRGRPSPTRTGGPSDSSEDNPRTPGHWRLMRPRAADDLGPILQTCRGAGGRPARPGPAPGSGRDDALAPDSSGCSAPPRKLAALGVARLLEPLIDVPREDERQPDRIGLPGVDRLLELAYRQVDAQVQHPPADVLHHPVQDEHPSRVPVALDRADDDLAAWADRWRAAPPRSSLRACRGGTR